MNQRKRLCLKEREDAGAVARTLNPGKRIFVQEWTDADGKRLIVALTRSPGDKSTSLAANTMPRT